MGPSARAALFVALLSACSGKNVVEYRSLALNAAGAGAAGVSGAAGSGAGSGGASSGGAAGSGGSSGVSGAGEAGLGGQAACQSAADCAATVSACSYPACASGACVSVNVALGAFVARDIPANCQDTVCDGNGGETHMPDPSNLPALEPCRVAACSPLGELTRLPAVAGATCSVGGGSLCDGDAQCVECLARTDCAAGLVCSNGSCVPSPDSCQNGKKDGDETDIDCGGACSPCAVTEDCNVDADCASGACDGLTPHRCLPDPCFDHRRDASETDTDCGGACAKCGDGRNCATDSDCATNVCMTWRGGICKSAICLNGVQDGHETALDCGGGICDGCALGEACLGSWDCQSQACDVLTLTCIADHCADHHISGDETGLDCGGPTCPTCPVGQRCVSDADCSSPYSCWPGNPHVCE